MLVYTSRVPGFYGQETFSNTEVLSVFIESDRPSPHNTPILTLLLPRGWYDDSL